MFHHTPRPSSHPYRRYVQTTTLGLDVDSVLCESIPSLLYRINRECGVQLEKDDVVQWDFPVGESTLGELILEAFRDPVFVKALPPMEGAVEAVKRLAIDFEIIVVTSRKQLTVDATREWVARYFGVLPVIHVGDGETKNGHDLDILVDDAPHNILAFADSGRPALLFDQPWNQRVPDHPLIRRCKNWPQVHRAVYAYALPVISGRKF